jgi:hypothetical protein
MSDDYIKCEKCGGFWSVYDGRYKINDELFCESCQEVISLKNKPHFAQHIPTFCSGFDRVLIPIDENFTSNFFKQINIDTDKYDIMYDDIHLMTVSKDKDYWWVEGMIRNYDIKNLGFSKWNYSDMKKTKGK